MIGEERIFVPKKLPKFTKAEKYEYLMKHGINPYKRKKRRHGMFDLTSVAKLILSEFILPNIIIVLKSRRSLLDLIDQEKPWRIQAPSTSQSGPRSISSSHPLLSADPHLCPKSFDAITEGHNHRTYIFAGEYVYQIWRDNGLQQRAAYLITDLFPAGPRHVNAAMTNLRSGVTVLFDRRKVYRFRWNKINKRFVVSNNVTLYLLYKYNLILWRHSRMPETVLRILMRLLTLSQCWLFNGKTEILLFQM